MTSDDAEFDWARQHAIDVAGEEAALGSPWPAILDQWGSIAAWQADCTRRRAADPNRRLPRVLLSLMADAPSKPRGNLREPDRRCLLADPALAAFWTSVADAGDDGWQEERRRIRQQQREAMVATTADARMAAVADSYAIRDLLPIYRAFGELLLEAGEFPDPHTAFRLPD